MTLSPDAPTLPSPTRQSRFPSLVALWMIVAAFGALAASCSRGGAAGQRGFQMPPVPVEVTDVQPQTMRSQFRALGSIDADESVDVVSELNATVKRLPFQEGSPITAGTLIAQLDDREAQAEASRAAAQHAQAKSNADRAQKLSEQSLLSQSQLDDAKTALQVAEANDEFQKSRLDKTRIRAPFSGVAGSRRVSPGAYLKPGDVITQIARLDPMKVRFSAPERFMDDLRRGGKVEVMVPAFPDQRFQGQITVVDPIVDPATRTVQLVARVGNRAGMLRPGMSGNVAVTLAERPNALVVPDEAVFAEGAQSFVFKVNPDSTVSRVPISLGIRDSSRVEVLTGLEPGARVVRTGHQKLYDGAHVLPITAEMMGGGGPGAGSAPKTAAAGAPRAAAPGAPGSKRGGGTR